MNTLPGFRSVAVVLSCSAAIAWLACSGPRSSSTTGTPGQSSGDFPRDSWETAASVEALGWSAERIAALETNVASAGSAAFMIVTRGRVVASWGDTARTFWTHSVRKSFMSALIGMAVAEGKIDTARTLGELGINEKAMPLTEAERKARVIDLLQARSGIYIPAAGEIDAMRDARPKRGSHAPGTVWYYNNWDFNVLGTVFRRATSEDIFEALDRRIARPIGMQDYRAADGVYGVEGESEHADVHLPRLRPRSRPVRAALSPPRPLAGHAADPGIVGRRERSQLLHNRRPGLTGDEERLRVHVVDSNERPGPS